jgi:hypothetical protein
MVLIQKRALDIVYCTAMMREISAYVCQGCARCGNRGATSSSHVQCNF